ncbi:alkaline phosphatase family protein [Allomuricauda sp. R78024]|uniref:alkaline phosphatase family protein n=1 Tax=Allomuricauda sp. R78024 TaxID=3093867 RepID=UPI0037CA8DD2
MALIKVIKIAFILIAVICSQHNFARHNDKPKLVVGIIIDQMRVEYLYRFQNNYTENGFKRLMREGFNVRNMHYNYVPTTALLSAQRMQNQKSGALGTETLKG